MSPPRPVQFSAHALAAMRAEAARAYPNEGCGALLGPADTDVREAIPLPNAETDKPRVRFTVSPADYLAVEDEAEARGLRLVGFWHSHPDHPARPSETDRQYAWDGLLTVVIAVLNGVPGTLTAWDLPGDDLPFRERPVALSEPSAMSRV